MGADGWLFVDSVHKTKTPKSENQGPQGPTRQRRGGSRRILSQKKTKATAKTAWFFRPITAPPILRAPPRRRRIRVVRMPAEHIGLSKECPGCLKRWHLRSSFGNNLEPAQSKDIKKQSLFSVICCTQKMESLAYNVPDH